MSFASYERLPTISNYMTAKLRLSVTQPIRKTRKNQPNFTRYPLSDTRRDTNFLIRRAGDDASKPVFTYDREFISAPNTGDEDIQLMLYDSPVITFHADTTEFTIFQGMYSRWSTSDCSFFYNILCRYFKSVGTKRGYLVMTDYQGGKYVLQNRFIRFRFDEANRTVTPVDTDNLKTTTLRLNRKATNIVRARYGEFYRYMKGMIGVRKEPFERKFYDRVNDETVIDIGYQVKITEEEWVRVVPTEMVEVHRSRISGKEYKVIKEFYRDNRPLRKPARMSPDIRFNSETNRQERGMSDIPYQEWLKVTEEFLALASTPSTDPNQTENFYKAFVWLAFYDVNNYRLEQDLTVHADEFGKTMDEIIFKYHSEEVFERVPIKPNTIPSMKYEKWVTREIEGE